MQKSKNHKRLFIIGSVLALLFIVFYAVSYLTPSARAVSRANAADEYLLKNDFPRAINAFQESLRLDPNHPSYKDIKFTLGVTFARAGRRDEAMAVMKELAQTDDRVGKSAKKVLLKMERNPNWGRPNSNSAISLGQL